MKRKNRSGLGSSKGTHGFWFAQQTGRALKLLAAANASVKKGSCTIALDHLTKGAILVGSVAAEARAMGQKTAVVKKLVKRVLMARANVFSCYNDRVDSARSFGEKAGKNRRGR